MKNLFARDSKDGATAATAKVLGAIKRDADLLDGQSLQEYIACCGELAAGRVPDQARLQRRMGEQFKTTADVQRDVADYRRWRACVEEYQIHRSREAATIELLADAKRRFDAASKALAQAREDAWKAEREQLAAGFCAGTRKKLLGETPWLALTEEAALV